MSKTSWKATKFFLNVIEILFDVQIKYKIYGKVTYKIMYI